MEKYVILHDRSNKPVYLNPKMVVAVYESEKRGSTTVYTILRVQNPFYVKESLEEARDIIWKHEFQI